MQSASSRIWTRIVVSISYDDNNSFLIGDETFLSSHHKGDIKQFSFTIEILFSLKSLLNSWKTEEIPQYSF